MRLVFADTFYWVALINPQDDWHKRVIQVSQSLTQTQLITTEEILGEVLTFYSKSGYQSRQKTVTFVRNILNHYQVQVIEQSHQSFYLGFALYQQRLDKGYSLTDCISMNAMKRLEIREILSHDKHFTQEGFTILLP
ncbi:MAG: PIN domain-containing protein [Crocosphaera sp.]|nr:PIN domain-containing protein [Crocosphaera sp.]